jgi:peptidyl-prolyl cis-trans isomerase SurA
MVGMGFKIFAVFCVVSASLSAADVQIVEQIVAKVNGDIVTRGELDRARQQLVQQMEADKVPATERAQILKERDAEFLKDQIDGLLLIQKGKELGISVDAEVTKRLADIQIQNKISDPDKFRVWVQEASGMPLEDLKQQMKNEQMKQQVLRQEVGGRISIPKPDLQKYYDEHKDEFIREERVFLREIFISPAGKGPEETAAAERRAKSVLERIKKGEKFPELARDMSDSETAKNFGEIGWLSREALRPELQDLFNQKKGYVTDVLKFDNGFAIYKLEERHEKGLAAFEDVENEITEKLFEPRMTPKVREYLTKLREEAFLEIRAGYVDSAPAPGKDTAWKDPAQLKPETITKEEVASTRRRRLLWMVPIKPATVSVPVPNHATVQSDTTVTATKP